MRRFCEWAFLSYSDKALVKRLNRKKQTLLASAYKTENTENIKKKIIIQKRKTGILAFNISITKTK